MGRSKREDSSQTLIPKRLVAGKKALDFALDVSLRGFGVGGNFFQAVTNWFEEGQQPRGTNLERVGVLDGKKR